VLRVSSPALQYLLANDQSTWPALAALIGASVRNTKVQASILTVKAIASTAFQHCECINTKGAVSQSTPTHWYNTGR
jgi:hypothetical protein